MRRATIISDAILWSGGHPPGHPLRPERLQNTWQMLQAYSAFSSPHITIESPRFPTDDELATFHTRSYIEAVRRLSQGDTNVNPANYNFGLGDNPVFAGMFESEGWKVGGCLVGAELLLENQADVVFNFAGGLHHAGPAQASGFCIFGDATIAIKRMLQANWRVAYIDIDAHHGDGVQNAFYDNADVLTISFHESGLYLFPGTGFVGELGEGMGKGYTVNIPLLPYTDDEVFIAAFDALVPPLLERFQPDVIVAQLGVDAHWRDPLTHLSLTTHGFEQLFQRIHNISTKWLAVGGGGYNAGVVPRSWTLAWGVMSEQSFNNYLPPTISPCYTTPYLHDELDSAPLSSSQRHQAQIGLEQVIKKLKKLLRL